MTWSDFYLLCFLVGFGLTVLTVLAGSTHLHLPHLHLHHGIHVGHAHAGGHGHGGGDKGISWFNFGTMSAFLAWFGGIGYLLTHHYGVWYVTALAIASLGGLGGASIVFWFIVKVLMTHDQPLDPADYEMVGVLGRLSIPIRVGGTGELIYSQEGSRRVTGARSESGAPIAKGVEVVVTRYEKGIAYVRPWDELTGELETKG